MATAKYATTVANPDGRRVTFAPGDDLPAWAIKAITNRDAIEGSSESDEAPAEEPESTDDEQQSEESESEQPEGDSDTAPEPESTDDAAPAAQGRRGRKPAAGADAK